MTRILTLAAVLLGTVGALAQTPPPKDAAAKTLETLQGTWVITSFNGEAPGSAAPEVAFVVAGEKYSQTVGDQTPERGSFKIDASKKPMWMDLVITEGTDAGKTQVGVFEIAANNLTLTMKLGVPGTSQRPASLAAEEGFFILVAAKKAK